MGMQVPNIFDFATKELSQDAFICWLIKLADCEGHGLQAASKEFIALLCRTGGEDKCVAASDVGSLEKLTRQKEAKIDIFFIAGIKGTKTCFIIEDKVHSDPHSKQLQKYYAHVQKKYPNLPIVKIYFKTGYLFGKDIKECEDEYAKYGILDYKMINDYLVSIETDDVIFNCYKDYFGRNFYDKFNVGLAALEKNEEHLLKENFVQYEFLKKLSHTCQEAIGNTRLETGTSFGDPYAEYTFISTKDVFIPGKNEIIFYRIESRKNRDKDIKRKQCYCLSVRQYGRVADGQQKTKKLARLKIYKEIFNEASGKTADIVFSKPRVDRTGANSSEISLLFFDNNVNSIQNVLQHLPAIHKDFVLKIQKCIDNGFEIQRVNK